MPDDPFTVLGLPAVRDLTDEDVRAAWRRIAAVTHPDLEDGGDPARYSAAAAAYDMLRTSFGRSEALADLGRTGAPAGARKRGRHATGWKAGAAASWRGISAVAGAAVAVIAVAAVGWTPASIALLAGAATWLFIVRVRRP